MKRYSVQIVQGEVVVDEPLPAGASFRVEFCLEDGSPRVKDVVVQPVGGEPEPPLARRPARMARGTPHPDFADGGASEIDAVAGAQRRRAESEDPTYIATHIDDDAAAMLEAADGDDGDDPDFDELPTIDVERSELEASAQGRLPLPPPDVAGGPAESTTRGRFGMGEVSDGARGNVLPPVSGTASADDFDEVVHLGSAESLPRRRELSALGLLDVRETAPAYPRLEDEAARSKAERGYDLLLIALSSAVVIVVTMLIAVLLR